MNKQIHNKKNIISIKIWLRGIFRQYSDNEYVHISVPTGTILSEIKVVLIEKFLESSLNFDTEEILKHSVFANETTILQDKVVLDKDSELTILPPVCGG